MSDKTQKSDENRVGAESRLSRRELLKTMGLAGAAASVAPLISATEAVAGSAGARGSGVPFAAAANDGFPQAKHPNEIWSVDYAGNLFPGLRNGPALYAMFFPATGMHVEDNGSIKVADARNSVLRNISNLGDVTVFSGSTQQYPFRDGKQTEATFNSPNDIDKLSDGSYVVGDRENNAIRQVLPDGTVKTIAGQGNCKNKYNGDQAIGTQAMLNRPLTLTVARQHTAWHSADTVYFADRDNQLIRKLVPNGDGTFALATVAGTPPTPGSDPCGALIYYPGRVDGPASQARFRGACGVVLSPDERYLYVAERDNNVVRAIDLMENTVGTYAGVVMTGQGKGAYVDGPVNEARFNGPSQIDYDNEGNLYVADRFNHVIRKITPSGNPMLGRTVETFAGVPMQSGRISGPANRAKFHEPWGLAVDRKNNLVFVGDTGNSRVAVIGAHKDIWPAFVERINKARAYEYAQLMAAYRDYYQGEQQRDPQLPNAYGSEGIGERSAPNGNHYSDAPRSTR
ncbi:MAG: hypothetical protein ACOY5C_03810 [Pseudomonadota bacterium]